MYKELVMIKNLNGFWDYVMDIAKTIDKNYNFDDAKKLLLSEYPSIKDDQIVLEDDGIYILSETQLECVNCKSLK